MKKLSRNSIYLLVLMFVAATAVVVYFMPADSKHKFSYEMGRPWNYELLTAPFDIPVYRDSATVNHLIDSIDRTFVPIYKVDKGAEQRVDAVIRASGEVSVHARNRLLNAVARLYNNGVVDASTSAIITDRKLEKVKFNVDNTTVEQSTAGFLSQRDAYAYIDSVFRDDPERAHIQALNLANVLYPNIVEDTRATQQYRESLIQPVVAAVGVIQKGERIIDRGDRVTPQVYQVLRSFELALDKAGRQERNHRVYTICGQTVLVSVIFLMLYLYFGFYYPETLESPKRMLAVVLLMVGMFVFEAAMTHVFSAGYYVVPFAILAVVVKVFFDSRTAFFTYVLEVVLCSVPVTFPLEFIFVELAAGTVVIFSLKELSKRSQLLRSALLAFVVYVVAYAAVEMMSAGTLSAVSVRYIGYFAVSAVLISFAYILIFIFEKAFGMTSVVTLVELADINNPLLRELSRECPGTFQHAMAVSNLASEAAHNIGANVQLVRAGALYHDIGKIDNPSFFTENQYGFNPHDTLPPEVSAGIIISHVTNGIKRADKAKLPDVIKDFIREHHGRGTAKYFYMKAQQAHPDTPVDPAPYTYPGPNPRTRETSLLMMADGVEAASRSMKDHSVEAITELVNNIIDGQVKAGFFNESPLSFRDIATVKQTFINRLRSMYHGRISYPPEKKPQEQPQRQPQEQPQEQPQKGEEAPKSSEPIKSAEQ